MTDSSHPKVAANPRSNRRRWTRLLVGALVASACSCITLSWHYGMSPLRAPEQLMRVVAAPVFAWWYRDDASKAAELREHYQIGCRPEFDPESWRKPAVRGSEWFEFDYQEASLDSLPQFVFESPNAPHIRRLRAEFGIPSIVRGARDEYDAMLKLGAWVGTRWHHGSDTVPGGSKEFDPTELIQRGAAGASYWCEIAARTMVHAATAVGWDARATTIGRDGYSGGHTVAELWSNQFDKWFVIDTDFNVVHEADNIPLSAYDLCHRGLELRAQNQLVERRFAPRKEGLLPVDLLDYYAYVEVDLRNDWPSRRLARGSPEGGDRATLWTARPTLKPLLNAKVHEPLQQRFDWPINCVRILAPNLIRKGDQYELEIQLSAYSPKFDTFEATVDEEPWTSGTDGRIRFIVAAGAHKLRARVLTLSGFHGPVSQVTFRIAIH